MPATSPRITITLDQGDYDTLKRLAKLQGVPMSRIIREFIRETGPILTQLTDVLETAQKAEASAAIKFRESAERAQKDLEPLADMIRNQFDLFADGINGTLRPETDEEEERRKRA